MVCKANGPLLSATAVHLSQAKTPHKWAEVAAEMNGKCSNEEPDQTGKLKELTPGDFCVPKTPIWSPETH